MTELQEAEAERDRAYAELQRARDHLRVCYEAARRAQARVRELSTASNSYATAGGRTGDNSPNFF